jgi:hypothetical protein
MPRGKKAGDLEASAWETEDGTLIRLVDHLGNLWLVSERPTGGGLHLTLYDPETDAPDPAICYTAGRDFVEVHRG